MEQPEQSPSKSEHVNSALDVFNSYVRSPEMEHKVEAIRANSSPDEYPVAIERLVENELAKSEPAKRLLEALGGESRLFQTAKDDAVMHYLNILTPDPQKESVTMISTLRRDLERPATPAVGTPQQPDNGSEPAVKHDQTSSYKPLVIPIAEENLEQKAKSEQKPEEKPWYKKPAPYLWGALAAAFIGGISYIVYRNMDEPVKAVSEPVKPEAYKPMMPKPGAVIPMVPVDPSPQTPVKPTIDASQLEQKLLANIFVGDGKEAVIAFKQLTDVSPAYGALAQELGWNGKSFDDNKFTAYETSLMSVVQSVYGVFDDHIGNVAVGKTLGANEGIKFLEHWERYSNTLTALQQRSTLDRPAYEAMLRLGAARMIEHIPKVEE